MGVGVEVIGHEGGGGGRAEGGGERGHERVVRAYNDGCSLPLILCLNVTTKARPSPVLRVSYLPQAHVKRPTAKTKNKK